MLTWRDYEDIEQFCQIWISVTEDRQKTDGVTDKATREAYTSKNSTQGIKYSIIVRLFDYSKLFISYFGRENSFTGLL